MAAITQWLRLAKDTVTVEPYIAQNKYTDESYGPAVSYRAHCVGVTKSFPDQAGLIRVAKTKSYIIGIPTVTPRDRVTLPPHFSPRQPPILGIEQHSDQNGRHHVVVWT